MCVFLCVQMIEKCNSLSRSKVFKEIEIFHICQGNENILNLVEYFEEEDRFYLVFDKMLGGTLLANIERRGHLTEREASLVIRDIAKALDFLHGKGKFTGFVVHLTLYFVCGYLFLVDIVYWFYLNCYSFSILIGLYVEERGTIKADLAFCWLYRVALCAHQKF